MALFDGLLGGGSADPYDLYGDILTAKQREALRARSSDQTWANAANFLAKAAMPTNKKIPLGGLLAGLAGAMGGGNQDEAVQTALKGSLTAAQIAELKRKQKLLERLSPFQEELLRRQIAQYGGGGMPPPAGVVPPAAPAPVAPPPAAAATMPPPMIVPPQPPVPAEGFPPGSGVPPGATTSLPAATQMAGLLGGGSTEGIDALGGGDDIWTALAALSQGGGGGSGAPFDLASLGQGQGLPDLGQVQVEPLSGQAAPAGRSWERDDPLIRKYESGNRNIMQGVVGPQGGYNPSVGRVTGPSSAGGYYQMIDPTWRAAAAKAGVDTQEYPRAIDAPFEVQQKVAKGLYEDEGLRPWAPYNRNLAAATGYSGGLPNAGRVNIEPLGGEAAPAAGRGVIPGLGITPEALATLNSMYEAAGIDAPFKSLLDTYYKSPGYLEEKVRTEEQAKKDIELKMDPLILEQRKRLEYKIDTELKPKLEEAVQKLQSPILKERAQAQADIDRVTQQMKAAGDAALRQNDATVIGPSGALTTQKITDLEFARRQQARAERVAKNNDTTYQPGDIVGTPIGAAPAEHQYIMTPEGKISAVPVPGTPAAEKAAETANKKLQTEQQKLISRDTVVREVDNIGKLMESAILPTTGFAGSILQNLGGTSANDIRIARQTLESRLSADALNAQRAASPTGAAFGNTSDTDVAILRTALVNLDQSQTKEQFQDRLQILKQAYVDAVHGPGMSRLLPETPVLKTPQNATKPANEIIQNGWRYDATTHKPIGPVQ